MGPIVKRRLRRFGMAGVIAAAPIAVLCAYVTNLLVPTEPLPRPATYEYIPSAVIEETNDTVGIADSDIYGLSREDVDKHLDEMQKLGVDTVRVLIPWADIQPLPPGSLPPEWEESLWARSEYIINAAAERGMAVLGVLNTTPGWGTPDENGSHIYQPPDPEKYGEWARTVAERYLGKVSAYEIWNEPNYTGYWVGGPDPEHYTLILRAAYDQIKDIDPEAFVVAGVVGTVQDSWVTMNPVTFVQRMYDAGAQGFFDALSIHPYNNEISFPEGLDPNNPWQTPVEQLIAIRQEMINRGDEALKIWATEYGLSTWIKDEQTQAEWVKDFLDFWSSLDYTGPAFLYTLRDRLFNPGEEFTEEGTMGIFTYEWGRKLVADIVECFNTGRKCVAEPEEPGDPVVDPVTAVVRALTAALQQVYTIVVETVSTLANAVVSVIADALRNLFGGLSNPATAALDVPADTRVALAYAAATAAEDVTGEPLASEEDTQDAPADAETDVTTEVTTDVTVQEPPVTEEIEETEEVVAPEVTEETVAPTVPEETTVAEVTEETTAPEVTEETTVPDVTSEPDVTPEPEEVPDVTDEDTEQDTEEDTDLADVEADEDERSTGRDDSDDDTDSDDTDRRDTRDGNKVSPGTGGAGNGAGVGGPGGGNTGGGADDTGGTAGGSDSSDGGSDSSGGDSKPGGGSNGGSNVSYVEGPWGMILYA